MIMVTPDEPHGGGSLSHVVADGSVARKFSNSLFGAVVVD
jgi:hypothetical protein